jgi:LPXTG cell wall anchor motif
MRKLGFVFGALTLGLILVAPWADADQWNKKTILTINHSLQIPGTVLQPGKYVVKLADSASNRHIVQVFNEDESRLVATILAIPNSRLKPTGATEFSFWETPKGTPPALRSWFYPGDNFGQEFAYPKREAAALSAAVKETVRAISDEEQASLSQTPPPAVTPASDKPAQVAEARPPAPPAPGPVAAKPARPAEPPQPVPEPTKAAQLPKTASPFPLIAIAGLLSAGAGLGIRALRRRLFPNESGLN